MLSQIVTAQSYDSSKFYFQIDKKASVYTTDSVLNFLHKIESNTTNNFRAVDTLYKDLIRETSMFTGLLVFDENGYAFNLHPSHKCVNYEFLLNHLQLSSLDYSRQLENILKCLRPISTFKLDEKRITAIIFWNFSNGIYKNDVPFHWERILEKNYGTNINIIKVNTDVDASWREPYKYNALSFMQKFLDGQNSSFGR